MKFKVGDKVKVYRNKEYPSSGVGTIFTVTKVLGKGEVVGYDKNGGSWSTHNLKLLSPKKKKLIKKKEKVLAQVTIDSNLLGEMVTAIMKNSDSEKVYIKVNGRWFVEA